MSSTLSQEYRGDILALEVSQNAVNRKAASIVAALSMSGHIDDHDCTIRYPIGDTVKVRLEARNCICVEYEEEAYRSTESLHLPIQYLDMDTEDILADWTKRTLENRNLLKRSLLARDLQTLTELAEKYPELVNGAAVKDRLVEGEDRG